MLFDKNDIMSKLSDFVSLSCDKPNYYDTLKTCIVGKLISFPTFAKFT